MRYLNSEEITQLLQLGLGNCRVKVIRRQEAGQENADYSEVRKHHVKGWEELRRKVLERDGFRCKTCNSKETLEAHHITPRHRGGADEENNLLTLCAACHYAIQASIRLMAH